MCFIHFRLLSDFKTLKSIAFVNALIQAERYKFYQFHKPKFTYFNTCNSYWYNDMRIKISWRNSAISKECSLYNFNSSPKLSLSFLERIFCSILTIRSLPNSRLLYNFILFSSHFLTHSELNSSFHFRFFSLKINYF